MKTIFKHTLLFSLLVLVDFVSAQNYIPYYPADWQFKSDAELVDFSQVKNISSKEFIIDGNEQIALSTTSWSWNNTHQFVYYRLTNLQIKESSFDIQISYTNPNGNQVKSVKIVDPNTRNVVEEWQYANGSFDVEKINVKRYLKNIPEPDVFEVRFQGNDDDFTQETIYTSQNTVKQQNKYWVHRQDDGSYQSIKKLYLNNFLDRTDSLIFNSEGKKTAHYTVNLGVTTKTVYNYKTRKVAVYGEEFNYSQLDRIQKQGIDALRFEYEFDAKGNWTMRKTYTMREGKWECDLLTQREIEYR